jgi:hypothetical protein
MNIEHVNNLDSIEKLEKLKFEGIDVTLAISLFEYGLVWKDLEETKETLFIYRINDSSFDRCTFKSDLDVFNEFDWVEWDSFLETQGETMDEWKDRSLGQKIFDLLNYYGYENIFGSSYWEGFPIEDNV